MTKKPIAPVGYASWKIGGAEIVVEDGVPLKYRIMTLAGILVTQLSIASIIYALQFPDDSVQGYSFGVTGSVAVVGGVLLLAVGWGGWYEARRHIKRAKRILAEHALWKERTGQDEFDPYWQWTK